MNARNTRDSKDKPTGLPKYLRLPPQEQLCPYCSLSRGKLNELILPSDAFPIPRVKSIVLPNRCSNQKGVRLIVTRSLFNFLTKLEKEQGRQAA